MTVTNVGGWLSGSLPDDTGREWPVVQRRQESARGPLRPAIPNLILHTTETDRYLDTLKFPSQWQCGEGKIGQHIKLGLAGDAVNNWDNFAQQVEMVGRSNLKLWLPSEATLGPTVALVAWLHQNDQIKTGLKRPALWPTVLDKGPQAVEGYYRRHAGLWPETPGVYGHVDIPDNSHWDPGSFDYPRFFARVQKALGIGDDDMAGVDDIIQGGADFRSGKPLPANATKAYRYGWHNEERIKKASQTPAPGVPAPHEHNLQGKAT
jgi:hypothetical protein